MVGNKQLLFFCKNYCIYYIYFVKIVLSLNSKLINNKFEFFYHIIFIRMCLKLKNYKFLNVII